jgi:hypothetical protein
MSKPGDNQKVIYLVGQKLSDGNGGMQPVIQIIAEALQDNGVAIKCTRDAYPGHKDLLTIIGPEDQIKHLKAFLSAQVIK